MKRKTFEFHTAVLYDTQEKKLVLIRTKEPRGGSAMNLRKLKLLCIFLPAAVTGGFEYIRHEFMLNLLSMETGNVYITLMTLLLSYFFTAWMFEQIERSNQSLAEEKTKRAVYEERERFANELHNNLAQTLFFLNVKLKQGKIEEARAAVSEIDNHLRQAIFNLRTLPEEGTSLKDRLSKWLTDWETLSGIDVETRIGLPERVFAPAEEVLLFGIVQEAFTNIRKHSEATKACLSLQGGKDNWSLEIRDNGKGLLNIQSSHKHYGIPMMQKKANKLGACFTLTAPDGEKGTRLHLYREKECWL
ncbi:sensor histidine kinase [Paenibacillus larvae]|uniref:histidine kinase n=2 Tax=Paenibacillus larvae TaxID=1464 RepID=V9W8J3_9BACL|nr:histidine kinase [Paenibacillus larvae]AHD07346.1 histidine kinase [Paenibacillus larvae subsp. larvae DSM 25430]MDR5568149.1 histidine kinase [Paenibacillus larvae]MDR5597581.1 histidine kinase [Paenibacillus larvae]